MPVPKLLVFTWLRVLQRSWSDHRLGRRKNRLSLVVSLGLRVQDVREGNQEVPHFEGRAGARAETETGPGLARRLETVARLAIQSILMEGLSLMIHSWVVTCT